MVRSIFALLVLLFACISLGDGMYAGQSSGPSPKLPYQKAILSYRNGIETMIVESELEAPPGNYAWVVPVPSVPTKVFQSEGFGIDRSFTRQRPGRLREDWPITFLLPVAVLAALGLGAASKRTISPSPWIWASLGWILLAAIFFPVFAQQRSAGGAVEVNKVLDVDDFTAETVRSKDPRELVKWLGANGFQSTKLVEQQVKDYVKEGWCFLAVRLKNFRGGKGFPKALGLQFASKQFVYPMRLTKAQGQDTVVDLLVIADGTGIASPLHLWRSRQSTLLEHGTNDTEPLMYEPDKALSWTNATITRLRGVVTPDEMSKDILIRTTAPREYQIQIVDTGRLQQIRWFVGLIWAGLSVWLIGLILGLSKVPPRKSLALCLVAGAMITPWGWYSSYPSSHTIEPGLSGIEPRS